MAPLSRAVLVSLESDIDPLILRARLLRRQGHHDDAGAVEEELHPVF